MTELSPTTAHLHDTVFDVDKERLAQVYALAALDAAGSLAEQQTLVEELGSLVDDVLDRDRRMEKLFGSALISKDDKIAMLERLLGKQASKPVLNLLKVMARHGRLGVVRDVARAARKLWETRSGRVRVRLETALPMEATLEREFLDSLRQKLGIDPIMTIHVNPDLLAGFVVRVGDKVYDASARTSLEQTRQAMVERAKQEIQRGRVKFVSREG